MSPPNGIFRLGMLKDVGQQQCINSKGLMPNNFMRFTLRDDFMKALDLFIDGIRRQLRSDNLVSGQRAIKDIKDLKKEMLGNKVMKSLTVFYDGIALQFRTRLNDKGQPLSWFDANWVLFEAYLYWRLYELTPESFRGYDMFDIAKLSDVDLLSKDMLEPLALRMIDDDSYEKHSIFDTFEELSFNAVWSNQYEKWIDDTNNDDYVSIWHENYRPFVVNDMEKVFDHLQEPFLGGKTIVIVLNEAGYELFGDLCLGTFFIKSKWAKQVRFHVKVIPWFRSAMRKDIVSMVESLSEVPDSDPVVELAELWKKYFDEEKFVVCEEIFWSLPESMVTVDKCHPFLQTELTVSHLVILKGNYNYYKLVDDRIVNESDSLLSVIKGNVPFMQAVSIRALETDLFCGVEKNSVGDYFSKPPGWTHTGNYGMIQFVQYDHEDPSVNEVADI